MDAGWRELCRTLGMGGAVGLGASLAGRKAQTAQTPPVNNDVTAAPVDAPKYAGRRRCAYACRDAAGFNPPPIEGIESKDVFQEPHRPRPRSGLSYQVRRAEGRRYGCGGTASAAYERHRLVLRAGTGIARIAGGGIGPVCAGPGNSGHCYRWRASGPVGKRT